MANYIPPETWTWDKESGGEFADINRPIAGKTHGNNVVRCVPASFFDREDVFDGRNIGIRVPSASLRAILHCCRTRWARAAISCP